MHKHTYFDTGKEVIQRDIFIAVQPLKHLGIISAFSPSLHHRTGGFQIPYLLTHHPCNLEES